MKFFLSLLMIYNLMHAEECLNDYLTELSETKPFPYIEGKQSEIVDGFDYCESFDTYMISWINDNDENIKNNLQLLDDGISGYEVLIFGFSKSKVLRDYLLTHKIKVKRENEKAYLAFIKANQHIEYEENVQILLQILNAQKGIDPNKGYSSFDATIPLYTAYLNDKRFIKVYYKMREYTDGFRSEYLARAIEKLTGKRPERKR
ncbi:MAG: hypothetical protein KU37_09100 [Sulfuricurvum sp. PC08-66]|nr:MAG: hypothetical protein KU37_09100 [Sulfuricurvum sp. PC08-66]